LNLLSFFSKSSSAFASSLISFDEILEIRKFFDNQNFYGSDPTSKPSAIPKSYVLSIFRFKLNKAKVKISQNIKDRGEEGLLVKWYDLDIEVKIYENSLRVEANIREFLVKHFNKIPNKFTENKVKLLSSDQQNNKQFMHVLFEKRNDNGVFYRVFIEIGSLEFKFFPLILRRTMSYFAFSSIDENLKQKAYNQVENLQKLTQVRFFLLIILIFKQIT